MPRPGKQTSHSSQSVLGPPQFSRVKGHPHGDFTPHVDLMHDRLTFELSVVLVFIEICTYTSINSPLLTCTAFYMKLRFRTPINMYLAVSVCPFSSSDMNQVLLGHS